MGEASYGGNLIYNIIENVFDNPEELSFIWSREKTVKAPLDQYQPTSSYRFKYIKDLIKLKDSAYLSPD